MHPRGIVLCCKPPKPQIPNPLRTWTAVLCRGGNDADDLDDDLVAELFYGFETGASGRLKVVGMVLRPIPTVVFLGSNPEPSEAESARRVSRLATVANNYVRKHGSSTANCMPIWFKFLYTIR